MSALIQAFDILGNYVAAMLSLTAALMSVLAAELFSGGRIDEVQLLAFLAIFVGADKILQGLANHQMGRGRGNFVGR